MNTKKLNLRIFAIILIFVMIAIGFSGCSSSTLNKIPVIGKALDHYINAPNKDNSLSGLPAMAKAVDKAISKGEKEILLFVGGVSEEDIEGIAKNMSGYWGLPKTFEVMDKYDKVKGVDGLVYKVRYTLKQSNNYYVYANKVKGEKIPEKHKQASEIADALDAIIKEVGISKKKTDYENALLLHDWIVNNFDYDISVDPSSTENGSYGGLINRKTMCQGYADSMKLLLDCATDVNCDVIVGTGNNGKEYEAHAWNQIKMDGNWYQVDATFDDPTKNLDKLFYHYYFGQSDEIMGLNHKWKADFFKKCDAENFLYYRYQGLFADNYSDFKEKATSTINQQKDEIELAFTGFDITDSNMQFVFSADSTIKSINWTITGEGDIKVIAVKLIR